MLLENKLSSSAEIELILFTACNLHCVFCSQDHKDNKTGYSTDDIVGKIDQVQPFLLKTHLKHVEISIMGGELFTDDIPFSFFKAYSHLARDIMEKVEELGKTCNITWVTNLHFKKRERVSDLLKATGTKIVVSYDFVGRQIDDFLYLDNLDYFDTLVDSINVTLTAPAISTIEERDTRFFDQNIYSNFPVFFDSYVPESSAASLLLPSDQELLDGLRAIKKFYPKAGPVQGWGESTELFCRCAGPDRKTTIFPDGSTSVCRRGSCSPKVFNNPVDYDSIDNVVEAFVSRHNCLSCEFYSNCPMWCFVQDDYKYKQRNEECILKTFFEENQNARRSTVPEETI